MTASARLATVLGRAVLIGLLAWAAPAEAQTFGTFAGAGTTSTYNFSGIGAYLGGGTTYVPFSATTAGFIPYSPGLGGGLGVQAAPRTTAGAMPTSGMGASMGGRTTLGVLRGAFAPLAPITTGGMGARPAIGLGPMGGPLRAMPPGRGMGVRPRPPVGGYPFRQPPSLLGPATSAPSMSM